MTRKELSTTRQELERRDGPVELDAKTRFYIEQAEKNRGETRQVKVSTPERMIHQMALIMADEGVVYPQVVDDTQSREKVALNWSAPHIDVESPKLDKKGKLQWGVVESRVRNSLNAAFLGKALQTAARETGGQVYNPLTGREQTEQELEEYYTRAVESLEKDEQRMEALIEGKDISEIKIKDNKEKETSKWRNIVGIPRNEWHIPAESDWQLTEEEKEQEERRKQTRRKAMIATASVSAVLGACNNQSSEVVKNITKEAEPVQSDTEANSEVAPNLEEQEVTPQIELTAQPPVEERFVGFEAEGEVSERYLEKIEELPEQIQEKLLQAAEKAGIDSSELVVQIIEREDEAGKVWHNLMVGVPASEGSIYMDRLWLYAEVNEAETQYVLPGEGVEGRLIPIGSSFVVEGENVGVSIPEGKSPEAVLFRLGYGEESNFQGVREFIYFDLENNEVWYTDPWTGERYQLLFESSGGVLAKIMPIEASLFPGLPEDKVREILKKGFMPDRKDDEWVVMGEEGEVELRFDAENEIWVDNKFEARLEEFLENLGDPANYEVNIGEFKYLPGEAYSLYMIDQDAGGRHVIPYSIIASEPYVKTWTASNGESYNMWQVEMAFPNSEGEGWSSIPVTVWVDYSGEDIRMGNTAKYDVAESTSFGFGKLGSRSNSIDVGFPDEGFADEDEYVDIRDKYLSNFEPGKGMVSMIYVRFPTKVEKLNQIIANIKQSEDYPGSNPYNRIWLWFGLWRSNDQSIFNQCLELGAKKIEPDKCQINREEFNTAGVASDLIFVDVEW